jgi:hypothetical protein
MTAIVHAINIVNNDNTADNANTAIIQLKIGDSSSNVTSDIRTVIEIKMSKNIHSN